MAMSLGTTWQKWFLFGGKVFVSVGDLVINQIGPLSKVGEFLRICQSIDGLSIQGQEFVVGYPISVPKK